MDYAAVQGALRARGYGRLGGGGPKRDGVDGDWGALSRAEMRRFQTAAGLPATGLPDRATLARLGLATGPAPPWYAEAGRRMGLHESRDTAALGRFLASDGQALGDPRRLPWCGDFVQTCLSLTLPAEPIVTNPYRAASWARFGLALARPALGAVLVFTRKGGGHVGFYAGERGRDGALLVRGGNQSDAVSDAYLAKARLAAIRWPRTYPLPTAGPVRLPDDGRPLSTREH